MAYYTTGVYPVQFRVDYPDYTRDRAATFFRLLWRSQSSSWRQPRRRLQGC
jgi:hypothetical protein